MAKSIELDYSNLLNYSKMSAVDLFVMRYKTLFDDIPFDTRKFWKVKEDCLEQKNPFNYGNVLYVHIPYCLKKCEYCDWNASEFSKKESSLYIKALQKEISMIKDFPYIRSTTFGSLYFGGGTPSILKVEEITALLDSCLENFNLNENAEISFEANPSTLNEDKVKALKDFGVTRVSLGQQSFKDDVLKAMNCNHTQRQSLKAINLIKNIGMKMKRNGKVSIQPLKIIL